MRGIRPASRLSRAATLCWIAAAIGSTAALVTEHENLLVLALLPIVAVVLIVASRRKKAAIVPGSFYATSADLVVERRRLRARQLPGELSFTDTAIRWNPSRYAVKNGAGPITVEIADRPEVVFEARGLAGVLVRIHRRDGTDLAFITHRTRKLQAALERLDLCVKRKRAARPSPY